MSPHEDCLDIAQEELGIDIFFEFSGRLTFVSKCSQMNDRGGQQQSKRPGSPFPIKEKLENRKKAKVNKDERGTAKHYQVIINPMSPLMRIMSRFGWQQIPAKHIWNFGYETRSIFKIVNSMPKNLSLAWKLLMDSMNKICLASIYNSKMIDSLVNGSRQEALCGDIRPAIEFGEEWECEDLCGIIEVKLEPSTQERQSLQANSCAAAIWGMSKQDFLRRFLACDLPLPFTQLDALRAAAIDIQNHTEALTSQHIRLTFGNCNEARAVLVCWTKLKTYDSHGRITAVSMFESDLSLMLTTSRQIRVLCIRLIWPLFLFANRLEQ